MTTRHYTAEWKGVTYKRQTRTREYVQASVVNCRGQEAVWSWHAATTTPPKTIQGFPVVAVVPVVEVAAPSKAAKGTTAVEYGHPTGCSCGRHSQEARTP